MAAVVAFCFRLILLHAVAFVLISECGIAHAQKTKRTSSKKLPASGGKRRNNGTAIKTTLAPAVAVRSSTVGNGAKLRRGPSSQFRPASRPPSALITCTEEFPDEASRTVAADMVFEGRPSRLLPLSSSGSANAMVNVEFEVTQLLKGKLDNVTKGASTSPSAAEPFSSRSVVVVGPFVVAKVTNRFPDCNDVEAPTVSGDSVPQLYIVFAQREKINRTGNDNSANNVSAASSNDYNYRISGRLVNSTNQTIKDVRDYACSTCGKRPGNVSILNVDRLLLINAGRKLQLECKARRGSPAPRYIWFKDGEELRRGSPKFGVSKVAVEDAGTYICRAINVLGSAESRPVKLVVNSPATTSTTPSAKVAADDVQKSHSERCAQQTYCLNGGTCYVLVNMRAEYCECSPSFSGRRCDERIVISPVKSKSTTQSNDPQLIPVPDFYFVIIILPSVGFTVSLSIVILVCCCIVRRSRSSKEKKNVSSGSPKRGVSGDAGVCGDGATGSYGKDDVDGATAHLIRKESGPNSQQVPVVSRNPPSQDRRKHLMESGGSRPDDGADQPLLRSHAAAAASSAARDEFSNSQPEAFAVGENKIDNKKLRTSATGPAVAVSSSYPLNALPGELSSVQAAPQHHATVSPPVVSNRYLPYSLVDDYAVSQRTKPLTVAAASPSIGAAVPNVELRVSSSASSAVPRNTSSPPIRSSYPYDSDPEATVI